MPQLINEPAKLLDNKQLGPRLYLMQLQAPAMAERLAPGQFIHVRIPGMPDHILRRPFSVYAWNANKGTLDILYQSVGFGTDHLAHLTPAQLGDDRIEIIGPIGNVWAPARDDDALECHRAMLVAGGAGAPALFMLASDLLQKGCEVDVVMGAATKDALVCKDRFENLLGKKVLAATDDGSFGRSGFCTSLVEEQLQKGSVDSGKPYDYVATCGPNPLMKIVAHLSENAQTYCEVSTEKRMACGIGACLSCVVDTVEGKKRSCVDGPIFDARKVVW